MTGSSPLTGGRVNYYLVAVPHPQREDQPPYTAECEDIIQALGMTFDEGCLFKALWRSAAARQGNAKPGTSDVYDAEKMVHYAGRVLRHRTRPAETPLDLLTYINELDAVQSVAEFQATTSRNVASLRQWQHDPSVSDLLNSAYRRTWARLGWPEAEVTGA